MNHADEKVGVVPAHAGAAAAVREGRARSRLKRAAASPAGRAVLLEAPAVLAGAFALSALLTWPVVLHLGSRIFGPPGDSLGSIAFLWQLAERTGFHLTGTTEIDFLGAPFGYVQGNGVNVQWAFVYFPAYLVAEVLGPAVAYNLVVLSGLALSAAAMYWLVRRLGGSPLVAGWGGLVFTVFPWHLEKAQGHATLAHLEGFPLLLLAVLAWEGRPTPWTALLVTGATAVLFTTSGYFGIVALVALAVLLPVAALRHRRRFGLAGAARRLALVSASALAVAVGVLGIAVLGSYDQGNLPARNAWDLYVWGARLHEFVVPSHAHPLVGDYVRPWLAERLHGSNFSESSLYVGWVTLLFAVGWLAWGVARRGALDPWRRFVAVAFPLAAAAGLVFSLPSPIVVAGEPVPGPSRLLYEVTPQFRVPTRFFPLVMVALVALAALGLEALRRRLAAGGRASAAGAVCLLAAALSFLELSTVPPATVTRLAPPQEVSALDRAPPGILAEYPLGSAEQVSTAHYAYAQTFHERPLFNGAPAGTLADALRKTLVDPAAPGTAAGLAALGVSAVVVRPNTYVFTGFPESGPPRNLGPGYRLVARLPDRISVWEVAADPAPAIAAFGSGFWEPETPPGYPTSRWLTADEGKVFFYARGPGIYRARFTVVPYEKPRLVRIEGRTGSKVLAATAARPVVSLTLALPAGFSAVTVQTRPGPQRIPDGRRASLYVSNWLIERLPERARPQSPIRPFTPPALE